MKATKIYKTKTKKKVEEITNFPLHHKNLLTANRIEFQETFKQSLVSFMHPLFGFDIIRFDKIIQTPDGQSTANFLKKEYGKKAHDLIERLLQ